MPLRNFFISYITFFTSYGTYTIAHKEYNSRFINPMFYRKTLALFRRGCTWSRNERGLASFFVHISPQRCISDVDCVRSLARSHDPFEYTLSIAGIVSFELFKRRPPKPSRFRFATTAAHARMRRDASESGIVLQARLDEDEFAQWNWSRILVRDCIRDACAYCFALVTFGAFVEKEIWQRRFLPVCGNGKYTHAQISVIRSLKEKLKKLGYGG